MAIRTYVVGLPVIITVDDEGNVEYDIDRSEAASAIRENEFESYDDDQADLDADSVSLDLKRRTEGYE